MNNHSSFLSGEKIKVSQEALEKLSHNVKEGTLFSFLFSTPTRLKAILLFNFHKDLCPSDFSKIIDLSPSAITHQLRVLERAGVLEKIKMGKMVCYMLSDRGKRFLKIINQIK